MLEQINLDLLSTPLSDEAPAGEDLRYTKVYDDIKEARRSEDDIPQGAWQRETKSSDWDKVIRLSVDALNSRTRDFQIAAWLVEALAMEEGFEGVESGLRLLTALLSNFWETAYPLVEEDDYDYRVAPFEFLNDKLTVAIKKIPLTDPRSSQGYSLLKWKESREVGSEADQRGGRRAEMMAEGKIPAEEFDSAVGKSSSSYYKALADSIIAAGEAFVEMDTAIDQKFGPHAPRVSEIGQTLDECKRLVIKICVDQKGLRDAYAPDSAVSGEASVEEEVMEVSTDEPVSQSASGPAITLPLLGGGEGAQESAVWNEALRIMQGGNLKESLNLLLAAAGSQPSERGRSRYRFLVAKLCLKAGRPDLAKPIVEQLYAMITEFRLENWESPAWVAEVMESLYQCLISAEYANEDPARAKELFRKICTMDVTKALASRM